jgi:hypothetical protein
MDKMETISQTFRRRAKDGTLYKMDCMHPKLIQAEYIKFIEWTPSIAERDKEAVKKVVRRMFSIMGNMVGIMELMVRRAEQTETLVL